MPATMTLSDALLEMTYAKHWTAQTHAWYYARLTPFITYAQQTGVENIGDVTPPLVRRYLADLCERPNRRTGEPLDSFTTHGHARAIRTLLFWAAAEDLLDERVPKRIALPRREHKVLQVLTDDHLERLFHEAKRTETPLRDTALLSLLLDTGCRAGELCGLEMRDVTFTPDAAWLLIRHSKTHKQREVGLGKRARAALWRYIHRERHATPDEPRIFLGRTGKPLNPEGLDRLLYRLRDEAGAEHFEGVSVGAHRWRHTSATRSLEAGTDLYTVSLGLGHSSIQTTTGYLRAVNARKLREHAASPLDNL